MSSGALYYFAATNQYDDVQNRYRGVYVLHHRYTRGCCLSLHGWYVEVIRWTIPGTIVDLESTLPTHGGLQRCAHLSGLPERKGGEIRTPRYFLKNKLMSLGDGRLGVPVTKEMHTYDDNCEFKWINLWDNIDHYYLAHCINWFMVSLLLRDAWILNIWSLYDEVLELSW